MIRSIRKGVAVAVVLTAGLGGASAQPIAPGERLEPAVPLHPLTRQEADRREALKLYARALYLERESLLVEATTTLEQALKLDPESAAVRKELVPLYLALDRLDDALQICREALDRDPGDHQTWYLYARQLKHQNRQRDAIAALERALACASLAEHPAQRMQVAFDLGLLYETLEDYQKAAERYTTAAAMLEHPEALQEAGLAQVDRDEAAAQAAETYERLGRVCVRSKQFDKAVAAFRKAQEKDPKRSTRLFYNLAEVYLGQGHAEQALACLDEYLTTQPQGMEAYELKIKLLRQLGREGDIMAALRQHSARDEANAGLKLLLARQAAQAGEEQEAERIFDGLARQSADVEAFRGLFRLYRQQGELGSVRILTRFDQAVRGAADKGMGPESGADAVRARAMLTVLRTDAELVKRLLPAVSPMLRGAGLHKETRRLLAALAARTHQLDEAEKLYRSCLEEAGREGARHEADLYIGLLSVLWQAHKYEAVAELCQRGLENAQNTNRVLFHADRARALAYAGRTKEALAEADAAVEVANDDGRLYARRNRALVRAEAKQFDQAVAECQALLKEYRSGTDVKDIRYTLSGIYSLAKDHAKSEEQLQAIIKEFPDDATAHNDLGYNWADRNLNLGEAERLIRRALELDRKQKNGPGPVSEDAGEDNAAFVDSLGWVLFRKGDLEGAKKELEKASSLFGGHDDPVVWDHLGDVYYRLNQTEQALAAWRKAVSLYEADRRRRGEDRHRDIQEKLRKLSGR